MRKLPLVLLFLILIASSVLARSPEVSHFYVTNLITIEKIKPIDNICVFIPFPPELPEQKVLDYKVFPGDASYSLHYDGRFGTPYLRVEGKGLKSVMFTYLIERKEVITAFSTPMKLGGEGVRIKLPQFMLETRFIVVNDRIKDIAEKVTEGAKNTVEAAKRIYEFVFSKMKYDKTVPGYGKGDVLRALKVWKGNCADFHSLFMAIAKAAGIQTRYEIGFPIPNGLSGELKGYHCWVKFFAEGLGWVPVDISEASKNPSLKDYYFGNIPSNRVTLSLGRDIEIGGRKLNYFFKPLVSVNGKNWSLFKVSSFYRKVFASGAHLPRCSRCTEPR